MSNLVHLLEPRVFEAATALANRRRTTPLADILQFLTEEEFARVVDETRACLEAADNVSPATRPIPASRLGGIHAGNLGLYLDARAVVILALGPGERLSGAYWARGVGQHATHGSAAIAHVWADATQALHPLAGFRAASPSKTPPEQP